MVSKMMKKGIAKRTSAWGYVITMQNRYSREQVKAVINYFNWLDKCGYFDEVMK